MCAVTTKKCATACAGTAPPPDDAFTSKYNNPSEYSKRYTLAGKAKLMLLLLGNVILPADFWEWYLQRAGHSELTNSFATYVAANIAAFGNRLPYLRDASRALATVTFAKSMLSWYVLLGGYVGYVRLSAAWTEFMGMACCSHWTILCCMLVQCCLWFHVIRH
jgi:hypothetical protein